MCYHPTKAEYDADPDKWTKEEDWVLAAASAQ